MKGFLIISVLLLGLCLHASASENGTDVESSPTNSPPTDAPQQKVPPPAALNRLPRGTVYQIRPYNPESSDFQFPDILRNFRSKSKPSIRDDEDRASASNNIRVINLGLQDSDAVEAVDVPKFVVPDSASEEEFRVKQKKSIPSTSPQDEEPWDASYAFGFSVEDQTRHEVSDPDGNVNGYYQYVDDEGYIRKVVYKAGKNTGFVVLNKEIVKGPKGPLPPKRKPPHKHNHNSIPASADFDSRPKNRPRLNYPESPEPEDLVGYPPPGINIDRPIKVPSQGGVGWKRFPSRRGRPIFVVKIRKPQQSRHEDDENDDGSYKEESLEDNGQWDGDVGNGPVYPPFRPVSNKGKEQGNNFGIEDLEEVKGHPRHDGKAYTFGYETDTSNRVEKSDKFGNVRGKYSYYDDEGIKREVHYIAGATTGFQVLGTSPSAARSVRIEAPPGFVVTRRNSESSHPKRSSSPSRATLATAESEYPSFPPGTIVYHIHPDSNSFNLSPWWDRPRRMRRIMRVHRKKPKNYRVKDEPEQSDEKSEQNSRQSGNELVGSDQSDNNINDKLGRPLSSSSPAPTLRSDEPSSETEENSSGPLVEYTSSSPPPPLPRAISSPPYIMRVRNYNPDRDLAHRPFRHSTRVKLDKFDSKMFFVRRDNSRPSHRAFTFERENTSPFDFDSGERREEHEGRNDPILFSPSNQQRRHQELIPNPIVFKPTKSKISVRNRGAPFEVAESNVYSVRSFPDQVSLEDVNVSTAKSMELSISSSTSKIPYSDPNIVSMSSSSVVQNQSEVTPVVTQSSPLPINRRGIKSTTTPTTTSSTSTTPTAIESETKGPITSQDKGIMSSSTRLMQRLGVLPNNDNTRN